MIIIWRANGDISTKSLATIDRLNKEITNKFGGRVEGPYFPQDASLMYIFHVDRYEWLNEAGRIWLKRVAEEKIDITPLRYEIAVTPKEFYGK